MSDYPVTYNPPIYRGQTFDMYIPRFWIVDGIAEDLTGCDVRAGLQDGTTYRAFTATISANNGPVSYVNSAGTTVNLGTIDYWSIRLQMTYSQTAAIISSQPKWEMDVRYPDGTVITPFTGKCKVKGQNVTDEDSAWPT